ncbi:MAG: hypothetical protein R3332_01335 [Pseudohongiellaceae bacterium]|nr:hypothetical protein [Pseudohongiellaceae bacterium]
MSNYYGKFYGYTGLFPVLDNEEGHNHLVELRSLLSSLANDRGSLFSRTGLVHGARFFILDDVVYNGHPTVEEHLKNCYLVLSMTFDGELEDLASRISSLGESDWGRVMAHCHSVDASKPAHEVVLEQLRKGQVTTSFLYVDASANLESTLKALLLQRKVAELIENGQGASTEERKALVKALAEQFKHIEIPAPGGFIGD